MAGPQRRSFAGYQIRHGLTAATGRVGEALPDGLGYVEGAVLGICVHGMFEEPSVLRALFDELPTRPLEVAFDELGDAIEEHVDVSFLLQEVGVA